MLFECPVVEGWGLWGGVPRPRMPRCWPALCLLLPLLLLPEAHGSSINCHKTCICASNIVSCSKMNLTVVPTALPAYTAVLDLSYNSITRLRAEWTTVRLMKLHNLLLSHNGLSFLSSEAFVYVSKLRYLDLSSNSLRQLDEFIFEPLAQLEVLLLYNNRISQIDRTAFSGLLSLQKLYLSQNQVSRFPLELVKERTRPAKLSLLDVSSNRIKVLPIPDLQMLPAWIRNGLYIHSNPLLCDCTLYGMLAQWHIRRLNSAVDFQDEYTCILPGPQKASVGVFQLNGDHMNCSSFAEAELETYLDQTLVLTCDTKHRDALKTWLAPGNVPVTPGNGSRSMAMAVLPDGNLQIGPARPEDSGVYTCIAVSDMVNETLYITVNVHNSTLSGGAETLNTAYTTLVGCLASVVLVLIYLYLTPCRCCCRLGQGKPRGPYDDDIHPSVLSSSPTHGHNDGDPTHSGHSCHAAFSDSKHLQGQNGKLNPGAEQEEEEREALQGRGRRRKSDAESVSSVSWCEEQLLASVR